MTSLPAPAASVTFILLANSSDSNSSTVTCLAAKQLQSGFHAFNGRFAEGDQYDESAYARIVADQSGAELHVSVPTAEDFVNIMPQLIYHMDDILFHMKFHDNK